MPKSKRPPSQSPLREALAVVSHRDVAGPFGVTLSEHSDAAVVELSPFRVRQPEFYSKVLSQYGARLEDKPRVFAAGACSFIWAGPGRWIAHANEAPGFSSELEAHFEGMAGVVDQSDGRCLLELGGSQVHQVLRKGVGIDLHPRAFDTDATAITLVSGIGVQLWRLTDAPSYGLLIPRSMIGSFWKWLSVAGAEFGVKVAL